MPRPLRVRDYFFRDPFWDIACGHGIQHKNELSHLYPLLLYSLQQPATQTPILATARSHIGTLQVPGSRSTWREGQNRQGGVEERTC